jgi:hypothetical protein
MPKTIGDTTAAGKPLDKSLPPGQKKKLLGYVDALGAHLDGLLSVYSQARPVAREQLRAHSPVLDAVLSMLEANGVSV